MDCNKLKEDVVSVVNAYTGIKIIDLMKTKCIDLFVQPLTSKSLGIGGIFRHNGRCFSHTVSLSVTESGSILLMVTNGIGLLKKILWCKEFKQLSELFLFIETRFDSQFSKIWINSTKESA